MTESPLTIAELKTQKRWLLWKLETVSGKQTKVPYQPNGAKAAANRPETWRTFDECDAVSSHFSGVGLALGNGVWGVDIDACCDAVEGRFTPESREIVIALDSYGEYSPSGTGCHVLGLGELPGPGLKRALPGCKAVEVKAEGFYFTFTGRHLSKTPKDLMPRAAAVCDLYHSVESSRTAPRSLTLSIPTGEQERFSRLMAGDISVCRDDHSSADFALCVLLAKRHGGNAFKVDAAFRESGLYREKWERDDYREGTITRAVLAAAKDTPVVFDHGDSRIEDDSETEFLVESLEGPGNDGWFPKGELSLIGAASGVGKTSWAMPLLEKIRHADDVWGHKVSKARDYRVLLHDRSKKAMRRTAKALRLSEEAMSRIVRLTTDQQSREPAEILEAAIEAAPGVEVWFIEGLDLWIPDMAKMSVVAPIVDNLQRIATRRDVAIIATVGAPKQKGKDRYFGRDALFGSSALARKVETVVLLGLHNEEDPNSVRRCWVLPRAGRAEVMFFRWTADGLTLTDKPDEPDEQSANGRMLANVQATFAADEPIVYREGLGAESSFYRWRKWAIAKRVVRQSAGKIYLVPGARLAADAA